MAVSPIPQDYPRISAGLTVVGLAEAMDWYVDALGFEERMRIAGADGKPMHGELRIGDSVVMVGEEMPARGCFAPAHFGGTPASLMIYVDDADAAIARAAEKGATVEMPATDMFYGDRCGAIRDPFGHRWSLASRKEELTHEQMMERMPKG